MRRRRVLLGLPLLLLLLLLSFLFVQRVLEEGPADATGAEYSGDGDAREYLPEPLVGGASCAPGTEEQGISHPAAAYPHRFQQLTVVIP